MGEGLIRETDKRAAPDGKTRWEVGRVQEPLRYMDVGMSFRVRREGIGNGRLNLGEGGTYGHTDAPVHWV